MVADASAQNTGNAWQGDGLLRAVADRIGRSATIALLVSPAGVLVISVARLLFVADYNLATASAIASSGGYVDALLGTVIPLVPLFLPYVALLLLVFNRVIPGLLAFVAATFISPMAANAGGTSPLGPGGWVVIGFLLLVLVLPLLVTLLVGFRTFVRIIAMVVAMLLLPGIVRAYPLPGTDRFYTQLLRQPWLPAETFTLSTGQKVTGYKLSDDGGTVEILSDASRTITFYPDTGIAAEQICQSAAAMARHPLIRISSAPSPHVPTCVTTP